MQACEQFMFMPNYPIRLCYLVVTQQQSICSHRSCLPDDTRPLLSVASTAIGIRHHTPNDCRHCVQFYSVVSTTFCVTARYSIKQSVHSFKIIIIVMESIYTIYIVYTSNWHRIFCTSKFPNMCYLTVRRR